MKLMSNIAKGYLPPETEGILVEMINVVGGWKKLDQPTLSTELACLICGEKRHYAPLIDPSKGLGRVWMCANPLCLTMGVKNVQPGTYTPTHQKRAVLWPLFCEINGIGDVHYDVCFEQVKQSEGKLAYMLKFANNPHGILFMQGEPGTGKTYASLAICEYFTRKSTSCIFASQRKMLTDWLDSMKSDSCNHYIPKITNTSLLVVDDFGTGEVTPAFMSFFMDLINSRMQWTNRGTIITTNLTNDKFSSFCGEALTDRINTGQKFEFKGKSRRTKEVL